MSAFMKRSISGNLVGLPCNSDADDLAIHMSRAEDLPHGVALAVLLLIEGVQSLFIYFATRSSRGDTHLITTQLTKALQENESATM